LKLVFSILEPDEVALTLEPMRLCNRCKQPRPAYFFRATNNRGNNKRYRMTGRVCRQCRNTACAIANAAHPGRHAFYSRKRRQLNPSAEAAAYSQNPEKWRKKNRARALDLRGCVRCDFTDPRALQVDHVNDDGAEHRRSLSDGPFEKGKPQSGAFMYRYYNDILLNADSGKFQLLCANCNTIKRAEHVERQRAERDAQQAVNPSVLRLVSH
jgi:hypothetical protein